MIPGVYLAGPVRNLDDSGSEWRDKVEVAGQDWFTFYNPLDKYDVRADNLEVVDEVVPVSESEKKVSIQSIVEADKEMVDMCDVVLVGHKDVQMIGTPMEVMYAFDRDVPIVIWDMDNVGEENMSPWFRFHADYVEEELMDVLIALAIVT